MHRSTQHALLQAAIHCKKENKKRKADSWTQQYGSAVHETSNATYMQQGRVVGLLSSKVSDLVSEGAAGADRACGLNPNAYKGNHGRAQQHLVYSPCVSSQPAKSRIMTATPMADLDSDLCVSPVCCLKQQRGLPLLHPQQNSADTCVYALTVIANSKENCHCCSCS